LKGQGFNIENVETNYSFTDKAPVTGFNYYRLKAVDLDNTFAYFGVLSVKIASKKNVVLFPNPVVDNTLHLVGNFETGRDETVQIYDNLGILRGVFQVSGKDNTLTLPATLERGSFLLKYAGENHKQTIRFTVR